MFTPIFSIKKENSKNFLNSFFDFTNNQKSEEIKGIIIDLDDINKNLDRLSKNWESRAVVNTKKLDFNDLSLRFDLNVNDFLEELLPFGKHEAYLNASESMKKKILTCGWLIYNEKTLAIEDHIVSPACLSIVQGKIPGLSNSYAKEVANQTMADEYYHSYMVLEANKTTSILRNIAVKVPTFNLVQEMNFYKNNLDCEWKAELTQLATAIVSEVFISDYLRLLSKEDNRLNIFTREVVSAHLRDEQVHGKIFGILAKLLYNGLNSEQKKFFAEVLPKPVKWFASRELDVWQNVLGQIGFIQAESMIADCKNTVEYNLVDTNERRINSVDYSGLIELASNIGIVESFQHEGLINKQASLLSHK